MAGDEAFTFELEAGVVVERLHGVVVCLVDRVVVGWDIGIPWVVVGWRMAVGGDGGFQVSSQPAQWCPYPVVGLKAFDPADGQAAVAGMTAGCHLCAGLPHAGVVEDFQDGFGNGVDDLLFGFLAKGVWLEAKHLGGRCAASGKGPASGAGDQTEEVFSGFLFAATTEGVHSLAKEVNQWRGFSVIAIAQVEQYRGGSEGWERVGTQQPSATAAYLGDVPAEGVKAWLRYDVRVRRGGNGGVGGAGDGSRRLHVHSLPGSCPEIAQGCTQAVTTSGVES